MMVDTSTKFVSDSIDEQTWMALATPDGEEIINADF
jgi:hypothetical protein